ncbi:hypothetical protein LCGC14_1922670, partial [marine sediment metagenome]
YDFRDEADGTSGTSIDFVDFVNLYDGGVEIVSSWQSHNKVLRLQDDATAGEDPHFHHNIVQTTSGTHEFWIGTNDVTKYWEFYTFEGGVGYINRLRISASSISYFDGGAWNVLIAVSNNIFYHVQLVWRADNTQDIYINGVLEADNVSTDDNMVSGVNRIFFKCFGDSTDYLYLDAYGETEDTTSHGGLGYTVDYNILSQDIEPILEGGYEIDNIQIGDTLEVVNVLDGHNNVVNITGSTNFAASFDSRSLSIYDTFSQGSGTIEFWGYFYDSPYVNQILFNNNTQIFHNGSFYWRYDDTDVFMVPGLFGQWVHFEIIWSGNDVDVYINGTKEIDSFWSDSDTTLTRIDFMSFENSSFYVDGVGFSWDSDYDVGDNINSHGKEVITELENNGWDVTVYPHSSIGVSGEFNSYKKILKVEDYTTTAGWGIMQDSFTEQIFGSISFYIKGNDTNGKMDIVLLKDGSGGPILYIDSGWLGYWDGGGHSIKALNDDTWYHIEIDFDCSTDTFDVYVDGILEQDDADFNVVQTGINRLKFYSSTNVDSDYIYYIDAISYSWEEPMEFFTGSYNLHANIEAVIDFVVDIPFDYYDHEVMQLNISSLHYTSIRTNTSFNLFGNIISAWASMDNDSYITETAVEYNILNYTGISGLFNNSGNLKIRYYAFNNSEFNLKIDKLNVTIYFKTVLSYNKTLELLGTWKYRFKLDIGLGSAYNQSWIYFNVILPINNFEGISENNYITRWIMQGNDITAVEDFSDDINPSNSWDLYNVAPVDFYEHPSVVDNYLLDNYTAQGSTYESPAQ